MEKLFTRIRERREALDLNQDVLADMVGTNQRQISQWELGKARPRADFVIALANALETAPNYLLGLTNDPDPAAPPTTLTAEEEELLRAFRRLPNRQRELLDIVRIMSNP